MSNNKKVVSLDVLLLFILTLATMDMVPDNVSSWRGTWKWVDIILPSNPTLMGFGDPLKPLYNAFKTFLLIAYLFVDQMKEAYQKSTHQIKLAIVSFIVTLTVIIPTINLIAARHFSGPSTYAHDGAVVQTEEAMKFLLKGKNPYSITYENTPVRDAVNPVIWERYGLKENPILYHFPYPPLTFLASIPLYSIFTTTLGWYDQRFLYLILFVATLLIAYKLPEDLVSKLSIVMVLSFNPFSVPGMKEGMNDILLLFWFIWMIYELKAERPITASAILALACGSKQMAWVMVPFFIAYISGMKRTAREASAVKSLATREIAAFATVLVFIFVPFLIWDNHAFISDILSFHSGTTKHPYPLRGDAGYGFANLVLHLGLVASTTAYFPFTLFQVIATLPIIGWLLFRQVKGNSICQMLVNYTLTLFVFLFFGRYMAANYLGFILSLLVISYFLQENSDILG